MLLIKYNALMALSAAKLPFAAARNVPLALIMIAGYAASFALLVCRCGNSRRQVARLKWVAAPLSFVRC